MKKKYIALILCTVIILTIMGGFIFIKNGNALHEGRALISKNGDFIFIDELETDFEKIEKMLKSFGIAVKEDGEYRSTTDVMNDVAALLAGNWVQELKG